MCVFGKSLHDGYTGAGTISDSVIVRYGAQHSSDYAITNRSYAGCPSVKQNALGLIPAISMFYGILIKMFFDDHAPPHFHA